MRARTWMAAAVVVGALVGCAAGPVAGAPPEGSGSPSPTPSPSPTASGPRQPAVLPASCPDLIGDDLDFLMDARELTLRGTDDTIQSRFSGLGIIVDGVQRGISCAYGSDDDRGARYEFGAETLTPVDRDVVLSALRAGPGADTTGLDEAVVGDALQFTQTGAPDSDTVPDDWAMVFTVYLDAWTMVWSPDGGEDVLDQHLEWALQLEESVYPGR